MEYMELKSLKVSAVSCSLPVTKKKAEDYAEIFGEKKIRRFIRTTGVKERYVANGRQIASDLCLAAAEEIFRKTDIRREDIDVLIFITQNPDYKTPSTAFLLQERMGLKKDCVCFDMNMGCTAMLHGVYTGGAMISSGVADRALLLIGDAHLVHPITDDTAETMMFGEAGAAVVLERGTGNIPMSLYSDGSGYSYIMNGCGERLQLPNDKPNPEAYRYYMDGGEVFNFTVNRVPQAIREFCKKSGTELQDYDQLVLHQANVFILQHIANDLGISLDQVAISMDRYGNTNGASIPVTIVDMVQRMPKLPEHMKLLVSGFGVGLSWGVMSFELEKSAVLPFSFSDDAYDEGKQLPY